MGTVQQLKEHMKDFQLQTFTKNIFKQLRIPNFELRCLNRTDNMFHNTEYFPFYVSKVRVYRYKYISMIFLTHIDGD